MSEQERMAAYRDQTQEGFQPVDDNGKPAPVDIDSDTGQPIRGGSVEPNDTTIDPKDGRPNDALGRTDSTEPEPGQAPKTVKDDAPPQKPGEGNYGRDQRNDIYENAKVGREQEANDEDSPGANYLAQLEAEAAAGTPGAPAPSDTGVDPEAQAVARAIEEEQNQDSGDADSGVQPAAEVDNPAKYYYIKVDGGRQVASEEEIRDAGGIEALQKSRSADLRFQDLATERRKLEQREADLDSRVEARVREEVRKLSPNQVPSTGDVPKTDRGTAGRETGVQAADVAQTIYDGDSEEAGNQLDRLIEERLAKRTSGSTVAGNNVREDEPVSKPVDGLDPGSHQPSVNRTREQVRANAVYVNNFPDLVEATAERPEIIRHATEEMKRRQADPVNAGRSLPELALEVGTDLRKLYMPPNGVSIKDVLPLEEAQGVVVAKRRLRGTQSSAAPSAHTSDAREDLPANYGQQHQTAFEAIKRSRGQK